MFDFYRYVHDSEWLGGSSEYSALDESSPYWFNGLVPLAFGLGDDRILGQVKSYLDYVLSHQQSDGWLGPENAANSWAMGSELTDAGAHRQSRLVFISWALG